MEVGFFLLLSLLVWVIYRSYHSPFFAGKKKTRCKKEIIRIGCGGVSQGEKDQKKAGDEGTKERFGYISRLWS